jgi:cellulose synthase/poly-beta-1,6-N-acetylglucosamine synthase-like glycosyltransferase
MRVEVLLLAGYLGTIALLSAYSWHRYHLTRLYRKHRPAAARVAPLVVHPRVTVQLPVYNEMYVIEPLLQAVCRLDYPRALLQIQVLDDSTDETTEIAERAVRRLAAAGVDITLRHRLDRAGFKAGALAAGLEAATGEYIAIFDADFQPAPDFLRRTLPHFRDASVGMVQARWGHLNETQSLLTKIQAIQLDAHFILEHGGRSRSGRFFNFNGTAGVWRRSAIETAGGWQHDTLTEDLDLSYRAQLEGWRFVFLPDVVAPGEVPPEMNGFKAQQYRWAKGSTQTCCKLLPRILRARLPLATKVEAVFHLTAYFNHPLLLLLSVLMLPALYARHRLGAMNWYQGLHVDLLVFASAVFSFASFYTYSLRELHPDWIPRLRYLPALLALAIGMSANNTAAVVAAFAGRTNEFTRTPKYGAAGGTRNWLGKRYGRSASIQAMAETAMGLYMTLAIAYAFVIGAFGSVPFLLLFQLGFLYTGVLSLVQQRANRRLREVSRKRAARIAEHAYPSSLVTK